MNYCTILSPPPCWPVKTYAKCFFFQTKMETLPVCIKTEEDEKEDVFMHHTPFLKEETPCVEPVKSER
jgi:hypothetical protein